MEDIMKSSSENLKKCREAITKDVVLAFGF